MSLSPKNALKFDSDPSSVANFVDRMHGECTALQWLRELVVNSIEAIDATGRGGTIFIHAIEQDMGDEIGTIRKLAVTDTGEGIAEDRLYSSFQVAMTSRGSGNYGIGAKIAALPMNPAGLIYRSLTEGGTPKELMWHRTARNGYYAAFGWSDDEDERLQYVTDISCDETEISPILETGHGTQVVLCGENVRDDTCGTLSPTSSRYKTSGNLHWVIRELNLKFWRIPENIQIRVENAKRTNDDIGPADYIVHGGEEGLEPIESASGIVNLEVNPYRVRWFLLDDEKAKRRNAHVPWTAGRIVGTLYRENTGTVEVYAVRRHSRGAALMNDFGIYTGADRVVLLIEPTRQELMQPTTARNDLRIADEGTVSAAYKEIGQEFASLMAERAPELAGFVKNQLEGLKSSSDEHELKEVIRQAIKLYQLKDYRRIAKGSITTIETQEERKVDNPSSNNEELTDDESEEAVDSSPQPTPPRPNPRPRPRPKPMPDPEGHIRASRLPQIPEPKQFKWSNLRDPDMVTNYTTNSQPIVLVNLDGETYNRLLALYKSRNDLNGFPLIVEDVIQRKCVASLQLSIFTLEQEFSTRSKRLGIDFGSFFEANSGRICLDSMASRDVHNALVREMKNLISKEKSKAAAESRAADSLVA